MGAAPAGLGPLAFLGQKEVSWVVFVGEKIVDCKIPYLSEQLLPSPRLRRGKEGEVSGRLEANRG